MNAAINESKLRTDHDFEFTSVRLIIVVCPPLSQLSGAMRHLPKPSNQDVGTRSSCSDLRVFGVFFCCAFFDFSFASSLGFLFKLVCRSLLGNCGTVCCRFRDVQEFNPVSV